MKHRIKITGYWLVLGLGVCFAQACNDWLDVKPKSEIEATVLFETENGFKDALTGIYLNMSSATAYGRELTFGFLDVLAQQYDMEYSNPYYQLKSYKYDEVTSYIDGIWAQMYNVITNINHLLEQLDAKRDVLHPNVYAVIKGEALGLRAFLHFDLLRIWGYGDLVQHPENLDQMTIPYVTRFEKHIAPQLTEREVLKKIHEDLDAAQELLQYTDTYSYFPKEMDYDLPNSDGFFDLRQTRFNFCALRVTQARVYQWEGNYEEAYKCVKEVYSKGINRFSWVGAIAGLDRTKYDLLFTPEHVFALSILDMYDNFESYQYVELNSGTNPSAFYQSTTKVYSIFEVPGVGSTDYRYLYHYDLNSSEKKPMWKFLQTEDYTYRNRMPLIRKSEIYYIMAECLNQTGAEADRIQAIGFLNEVRQRRNIQSALPETLTPEEVTAEIQKEYQKEFISEGQLFYYYKRLGMETIPFLNVNMDNSKYIVPLPAIEMEFGRVDQIPAEEEETEEN